MRIKPTHEKIVGIRTRATDSEELHEIVKLAMDISADRYRTFLLSLLISPAVEKRFADKKWQQATQFVTYHWLYIRFIL